MKERISVPIYLIDPYTVLIMGSVLVLIPLFLGIFLSQVMPVYLANHVMVPVLQWAIKASSTSAGHALYWLCSTDPMNLASNYQLFLHQDVAHFSFGSWSTWMGVFARDLIPFAIPLLLALLGLVCLLSLFNRHIPLWAYFQRRRSRPC